MVLIESESDDEISVTEVPIPSRSSSSPPKTTEAKIVGGDDSEGFETASEREVSDNEEEEEEDDRKEDAIENQEPQPSDNPEKKEEQVEAVAVADVGSNQEKALEDANEAKMEGNKLFGNGLYEDALSKYELALQFAQEFPESVDLRSICHSNRAICYLKLGKYAEAIKECTKAIELNPSYTKALVRRAEAHEKLEHFEEALTDLKRILELDPSNDQARKGIRRLEPLAAEKREKMKEEAIAKLKEMGNTILGKFGMSVDNFKAVKDPNTGSYSFSFQN
ncbi:tetratricopeptide repeat protein 1 isoform X2 [Brassica napus]|uniref:tetratricopeptide repeat protein 1 isoform X2 n=1 Tax=Brassica napus TaxID=3708 RepID=UPI00207A6E78|nr:tetratricopeptide repeat protein 1 isoform X2 [Brassica napus]